jgi:hypothetical protein
VQTEQHIRRALDGTFTRFTYGERGTRVVTRTVARDFVPDYSALEQQEQSGVANRSPRRMFSHEDDCRILELRAQKVPMIKIAQLLDRNVKSVTVRYGRILSAGVLA